MVLKISKALLVASLGLSVCAQAAEHEFSGEVAAGVGFKPEFVKAEGDGKYALVSGKVKMTTDKSWAVALTESVKATEHPERKTAAEDPVLSLTPLGNPLEGTGLSLGASLIVAPGLSLESRDADYYGAVKPVVTLSKKLGDGEVGVGASVTRHFRRYTLSPAGKSTTEYGVSSFAFGSYDLGAGFSASLSLAYKEAMPYEGAHKYGYLNEVALGYAVTKELSVELDLSTSDSLLAADGTENNEFSLYRQNQTEMYLGASYAL